MVGCPPRYSRSYQGYTVTRGLCISTLLLSVFIAEIYWFYRTALLIHNPPTDCEHRCTDGHHSRLPDRPARAPHCTRLHTTRGIPPVLPAQGTLSGRLPHPAQRTAYTKGACVKGWGCGMGVFEAFKKNLALCGLTAENELFF